ncbi:hypothetical protein SAMN05421781_0623 [Marinococcus luteus]|uniref:Uncharacterized protein n=1 Tax=Marinococcus luteus TaxID=1122204 RepID=A0A1H2R7Q5_9BACI|nr:hypothetical protein [Marinococcus luteus]SDW15150.1 hypothetical protein SAMN05421781_0623 [Marinococcus luteus]
MSNIKMDRKTAARIRRDGGVVTLDPFYFWNQKKDKGPVDTVVQVGTPAETAMYTRYQFEDISVYVHERLQLKKELRLFLHGFGPFEHLNCAGVKRFSKPQKTANAVS